MQCHGFDLLWGDFFQQRGYFSLGVKMGSDFIPLNSFGWEHKPRCGLCTHAFHCTDSKDPDIHDLDRCMPATKTHPDAPSMKTECDYLNSWIEKKKKKKWSHAQNLTQNSKPQRYRWGTQNKKKKNGKIFPVFSLSDLYMFKSIQVHRCIFVWKKISAGSAIHSLLYVFGGWLVNMFNIIVLLR